MLERGAEPNIADSAQGLTALHYAVAAGNGTTVTKLREHGAMVRANHAGISPLHWAADAGRLDLMQLLLDNNFDAENVLAARDAEHGHTPLAHLATALTAYV